MRNLNIDILIQNIQSLMDKDNLTQQQLADAIGMSQSNFNRAINNKDGQRFTLEQVCNIANHFNVSVDCLLGFEKESTKKSEREICSLFTSLLEQRKLIKVDTSREEEIYTPFVLFNEPPDFMREKKTVHYPAFFFPSYIDVGPLDRFTDEQIEEFRSDIYYNGNHDEANKRINAFFEKYFQIYEMYLRNQITEELFHEITEKFLDDLN